MQLHAQASPRNESYPHLLLEIHITVQPIKEIIPFPNLNKFDPELCVWSVNFVQIMRHFDVDVSNDLCVGVLSICNDNIYCFLGHCPSPPTLNWSAVNVIFQFASVLADELVQFIAKS